MVDFAKLREGMIKNQLVRRGIKDSAVIEAFKKVHREEFIPEKSKNMAYQDVPLPIMLGQTISQPYIIAIMTQTLELDKNSKVLEVGTGSGYQAAILAEITEEVYSIERLMNLFKYAKKNLTRLKYDSVNLIHGDGTLGYEDAAPYNGIIVTAGAPNIPEPLIQQLDVNGRLVIPVGGSYSQVLKKITKTKKGLNQEEICGCIFVPLIGKKGWGER